MDKSVNRRQFFRQLLTDVLQVAENSEPQTTETSPKLLRPPGALPEEKFVATCQKCVQCANACPHNAITFSETDNTPVIDPSKAPCLWCRDMPCIHACPSNVLTFDEQREVTAIGKAVLDLSNCLTQQGILCEDCALVCPSSARAIKMVARKPQLDPSRCVGCGLCAFHCTSSPVAITIEPVR